MNEENNPELENKTTTSDSELIYNAVPNPGTKNCGIALIWISIVLVLTGVGILIEARYEADYAGAYLILYLGGSLEFLGWMLYLVGCVIHTIRKEATATRLSLIFPYKTLEPEDIPDVYWKTAKQKTEELNKKLTLSSKF
tara:strand:+ start:378 stop:797 length:420 start_codon:yes stop_codon:yes gene_type:complete